MIELADLFEADENAIQNVAAVGHFERFERSAGTSISGVLGLCKAIARNHPHRSDAMFGTSKCKQWRSFEFSVHELGDQKLHTNPQISRAICTNSLEF